MRAIAIASALCLAAAAPAIAGSPPVLTDLTVTLEDGTWVASGRLMDGLSPELLEEIEAGLETTIDYRIQVHRQRSGLPNPVVVKHRIECTVRHDALTRQYTLTRRIDKELQETRVTTEAAEMREFMTVLDRLPVVADEELTDGETYYLKARSDLGLIWRFYLIPWRQKTAWAQVPMHTGKGGADDTRP